MHSLEFEIRCVHCAGGCQIQGVTRQSSIIHGNDPATVTFTGIKLTPGQLSCVSVWTNLCT